MAEFKRLSDVEVVAEPTESANVLIEENGVIKKAPKTAVGGAGGMEPDMIVDVVYYEETATIVKGSYDELLSLCQSNGFPKVVLNIYGDLGTGAGSGIANMTVDAYVTKYYSTLFLTAPMVNGAFGYLSRLSVELHEDGSVSVNTGDLS